MSQGKPAVRTPTPCGRDGALAIGREPSQLGWYEFVGLRHIRQSVLDVGAGLGAGMALLEYHGVEYTQGFDTDERLKGRPWMQVGKSPREFWVTGRQFEVVTAIDVIEHVVDDRAFLDELKSLAIHAVYVSTPNGAVSKCRNEHHAREYTIPEFVEIFKPDEVWGSLNGGWVGREQIDPSKLDPRDSYERFPHFCAVFHAGEKASCT